MSKGGSTTSSTEIPAWLENAAIENINKGRDVSEIGYTPYYGPEVAAFSPMQQQSMRSTGSAASAFGLAPQGFDGTAGIPQAQTFAGGVQGYSSAPLYEESLDKLFANAPAQYNAINNMFIDPFTGAAPSGNYAPSTAQVMQSNYAQGGDVGTASGGAGGGFGSDSSGAGGGFGSDSSGYDRFPADNAGAFDYNNDMFTQSDTGAYYPVQEQAQLKDIMGGGVYGLMGDMLGGDSNPLGGALSAYADMSPMSDFVNQVQYGMNEGSMNQYEAMSKSNPNWINMSEGDRVNAAREAYKAGTPLPSAPAPVNVEPAPYQGGGLMGATTTPYPESNITNINDGYYGNGDQYAASLAAVQQAQAQRIAQERASADAARSAALQAEVEAQDYADQQAAAAQRMAAEQAAQDLYNKQLQAASGNNNRPAPATGGGGWSQPSPGSGGSYGGGGDSYDPSGRF